MLSQAAKPNTKENAITILDTDFLVEVEDKAFVRNILKLLRIKD
jgi:hypothetical protein